MSLIHFFLSRSLRESSQNESSISSPSLTHLCGLRLRRNRCLCFYLRTSSYLSSFETLAKLLDLLLFKVPSRSTRITIPVVILIENANSGPIGLLLLQIYLVQSIYLAIDFIICNRLDPWIVVIDICTGHINYHSLFPLQLLLLLYFLIKLIDLLLLCFKHWKELMYESLSKLLVFDSALIDQFLDVQKLFLH